MYIMDSNRSKNLLKLDIESILQIIAEIKHNHQLHEAKKESNQTTTQIISQGKVAAQTPLSYILYIQHGCMKQIQCLLFSQESLALIYLSHIVLSKN